jgi:hypothetical protein
MPAPLVSDALWPLFAALLPPRPPRRKGGCPPIADRAALTLDRGAIKGLRLWHELLATPPGLAGGGYLAGVPPRPARSPRPCGPDRREPVFLGRGERRDCHRAEPDRSRQAGQQAASRRGSSGHPAGRPAHRPANVHDSTVLEEALDAVPSIRQPRGRPRRRPKKLHTDKAVRLPPLSPRLSEARYRSADRATRHREPREAPPTPPAMACWPWPLRGWSRRLLRRLGGGTDPVLDRPLPSPDHPLRAPRR